MIAAPVFLSKSSILAARPDEAAFVVLSHTFQKREGRSRKFGFGIHRRLQMVHWISIFEDNRASGLLIENGQ